MSGRSLHLETSKKGGGITPRAPYIRMVVNPEDALFWKTKVDEIDQVLFGLLRKGKRPIHPYELRSIKGITREMRDWLTNSGLLDGA